MTLKNYWFFHFQIQLEKIRDSDIQVRWQHEEDVDECPTCKSGFTVKKKKEHCRHCGTIFCGSCLSHSVRSGPNMRPSKVCDVCHTLLVKSSAPYFSEAPPQNNWELMFYVYKVVSMLLRIWFFSRQNNVYCLTQFY